MVYLHPYMTIGKTIVLAIMTFVGKVTSLLFTILSRFVIAFMCTTLCLLLYTLQWGNHQNFNFSSSPCSSSHLPPPHLGCCFPSGNYYSVFIFVWTGLFIYFTYLFVLIFYIKSFQNENICKMIVETQLRL